MTSKEKDTVIAGIKREVDYLIEKRTRYAKLILEAPIGYTEEESLEPLDLSLSIAQISAQIKQWTFLVNTLGSKKECDVTQLGILMVRMLDFGKHKGFDWSTQYIPTIEKLEMLNTFMAMLSWGLGDSKEDQQMKAELRGIAKGVGFHLKI